VVSLIGLLNLGSPQRGPDCSRPPPTPQLWQLWENGTPSAGWITGPSSSSHASANAAPQSPPLTLARCYSNLNRDGDARRELQIALEESVDPGVRTYLGWCIQAIDTEPERRRQHEAIAAAVELRHRADRAFSLFQTGMVAAAVAEFTDLTKNRSWNAGEWYNFACAYSLASAKIADK
jgi:predicted Zn-dependent protease